VFDEILLEEENRLNLLFAIPSSKDSQKGRLEINPLNLYIEAN